MLPNPSSFKVLYRRTIFDSKETGGMFHKNELQHQDPETFSGQPEGAQNVKTFTAEGTDQFLHET